MNRSRPSEEGARCARDKTGGYLLIEALATLALSALVMGGLLSLSAVFLRSSDRAAARLERLETQPRTIATIAREIRQAVRPRLSGGDVIFLGLPDRIVFALDPVQGNGLRSPVAVAYQAAQKGVVLRAEGPIPIGASRLGDVVFGPVRRLSVGPDAIRFSYVGRAAEGGELVTETWDNLDVLPDAIRLDRVNAEGVLIASLRVPLIVQADPGCAAPEAGLCARAPKTEGPAPEAAAPSAAR